MNDLVQTIIVIAGGAGLVLFVLLGAKIASRFLHVCRPNEVLVFSGRRRRTVEGREVGVRIVSGGRAFRMPVLEKVDRMDVTLISVPMSVSGAYSDGGIPLAVTAIANVKVATDPALVGNAIERFLGKSNTEIARVAKETLEGHLRGVLATMTPEDVNEDRLKFAERLSEEAGPDLAKLGLQLDTLKIQHVSDDRSYLDSLGRSRIADVLRTALVAESDARRTAEQSEAEADARAQVASTRANANVQRRQNEARQLIADLTAEARAEEERTEQAGPAVRAHAEQELHRLRAELEGLRLAADVGVPADVAARVQALLAEGDAAAIAAKGEAVSQALSHLNDAWLACGDHARDMIAVQHVDEVFARATAAAGDLHAKHASLLDAGDGQTVASYVAAYPATVRMLLDQLSTTFGVRFAEVLRGERDASGDRPPLADEPLRAAAE